MYVNTYLNISSVVRSGLSQIVMHRHTFQQKTAFKRTHLVFTCTDWFPEKGLKPTQGQSTLRVTDAPTPSRWNVNEIFFIIREPLSVTVSPVWAGVYGPFSLLWKSRWNYIKGQLHHFQTNCHYLQHNASVNICEISTFLHLKKKIWSWNSSTYWHHQKWKHF